MKSLNVLSVAVAQTELSIALTLTRIFCRGADFAFRQTRDAASDVFVLYNSDCNYNISRLLQKKKLNFV